MTLKATLFNAILAKTFLLSIVLLASLEVGWAQVSLKGLALPHGKYQVGFQHYVTHDSTRTYQRIYDLTHKKIARPIHVSIWYPAQNNVATTKRLRVIDYMQIYKEEKEWEHLPNANILGWFQYENTEVNRQHLQVTTQAYLNAPKAGEGFPAIVYAPGLEYSSIENFALNEFLASHGYVVIASPSRGSYHQFMERGKVRNIDAQARDISFLIQEMNKYSQIDQTKIATMGYSFGGLSNVLAQMRDARIKAIVSLDGSVRYNYKFLMQSPFADMAKVNVPFIHMAQQIIPDAVLKADKIDPALNTEFKFFDLLQYSKAYKLRFHHLSHAHFITLGVLFQKRDLRKDKSDLEIMTSYRWLATYALQFLNAFIKNDPQAKRFMANMPAQNGIPAGLISKTVKDPKPRPFGFRDFNELAAQRDYKNLSELYASCQKKYPKLQFGEIYFNKLGLQLGFNRATSQQGIRVMEFAAQLYPKSANVFDSLGELYFFMKNKQKAIQNFEKSLQLYKQNDHAIRRLKELRR